MNPVGSKMSELAKAKYTQRLTVSLPTTTHLPMVNARCHYNAVQAVKTGLAAGVVEVVMLYSNGCTAHYINLMADGSYVDFTLGQMCIDDDYRLVRHVSPNEYDTINDALGNLKKKLTEVLPWHLRILVKNPNNWC